MLICTGVFPPEIGGAGAVVEALASAAPDRITILTQHPPAAAVVRSGVEDRNFPFRVFRIDSFYKTLPGRPGRLRGLLTRIYNRFWIQRRAWRQMKRHFAGASFDVVCLGTIPSGFWLPPYLRRLRPRRPVVAYVHGEELGMLRHSRAARRWLKGICQADAVVAVSSFTRTGLIEHGIPAERVHVINNGVDTAYFTPGPPREDLLERFGLQGRPVILCLARLDARKGQDQLIAALPQVLQEVPNAALVLVGGGDDEPRLRRLVEELHLTRAVTFTGPASREDVVGWYRTADIYAMPNRAMPDGDTEGFGLVFLEANACGLPVIGGKDGGVPDAIAEGQTGFLVDGRSQEQIADRCLRLLRDPELRIRMSRNAVEYARRNAWRAKAEQFLALCDQLVATRPPRKP